MVKAGIVGLPNVGKSTLFNALLKKRIALSANYPFATIEPNIGVVGVLDPRLNELAELVKNEDPPSHKASAGQGKDGLPPIVPAVVEFVDIAGLVKGASTGEGLGNQFLSHIREVDAIIHVLRDFEDENVIRAGAQNPDADKLTIETELALADIQTLEKLIPAQEKLVKASHDPIEQKRLEILNQLKKNLDEGKILGHYEIGDERLQIWFKTLPLLTIKPILYVLNVSESEYQQKLKSQSLDLQAEEVLEKTVVICAKLEEELADYSEAEKVEYLKQMGIEETGLERLVAKAYEILGLISFLTAGKKEVRAWTIEKGTKAAQAAGVIHTDFEKGFIRAQVIDYQKLIEAGSYLVARQKGWIRTEGKDYLVRDGDVIEFLVNS